MYGSEGLCKFDSYQQGACERGMISIGLTSGPCRLVLDCVASSDDAPRRQVTRRADGSARFPMLQVEVGGDEGDV